MARLARRADAHARWSAGAAGTRRGASRDAGARSSRDRRLPGGRPYCVATPSCRSSARCRSPPNPSGCGRRRRPPTPCRPGTPGSDCPIVSSIVGEDQSWKNVRPPSSTSFFHRPRPPGRACPLGAAVASSRSPGPAVVSTSAWPAGWPAMKSRYAAARSGVLRLRRDVDRDARRADRHGLAAPARRHVEERGVLPEAVLGVGRSSCRRA